MVDTKLENGTNDTTEPKKEDLVAVKRDHDDSDDESPAGTVLWSICYSLEGD